MKKLILLLIIAVAFAGLISAQEPADSSPLELFSEVNCIADVNAVCGCLEHQATVLAGSVFILSAGEIALSANMIDKPDNIREQFAWATAVNKQTFDTGQVVNYYLLL